MTPCNPSERMPTILEVENIDETLGPEEMTRVQLLQKIDELIRERHFFVREEMTSDKIVYDLYNQNQKLQRECEGLLEKLAKEEIQYDDLVQDYNKVQEQRIELLGQYYELYNQKEGLQLECERLRLKCDKLWDKSQGLTTLLHRARIKLELLFSLHAAYASACMWCNCYIIYSFFHIASLWLL